MNLRLESFFENPTLLSAIVIIVFILSNVIIVYLQNRNNKKQRADNKQASNTTVTAMNKLANQMQVLLDKEVNNVNLQNVENIIASTLRKSEAIIKDEVRRIFFHNNRNKLTRQRMIKKALSAVTQTAYNNDLTVLSKFFYKENNISSFLVNINKEDFFSELLILVFNKSDNSDTDLQDCLYYIESNFNSYITNAKSYYSNL